MGQPPGSDTGRQEADARLVRGLSWWVLLCQRRPVVTLVLTLALSAGLGVYATRSIGFNVDPNALFPEHLRFQQMILRFERYFPVLTNSLLIVVDGKTPEATRAAQVSLLAALQERTDVISRAFLPGEEPFFESTGLLYGSVDDLEAFADSMALLQPVVGELSRDPSLPTLARTIRLGLEQTDPDGEAARYWETVLDHFHDATVAVFDEYPVAVSWESVLLADSGFAPVTLRVIVADPILDLSRILASGAAIEAVHEAVEELGLGPDRGVRVRITGYPALNHEEMLGIARDTAIAGSIAFLLVLLALARAFGSARLVLASAITLVLGLIWSAAFAGASVGDLNPFSIAFGVLVIGIGVDFLIHFGMHFAEGARAESSLEGALLHAVRTTGTALVLCATTTAVGFLAFVPTDYRGVSDLGLLASGGMLAVLFLTLTSFPALLRVLFPPAALARLAAVHAPRGLPLRVPRPWAVCAVAGLLGVLAVPLVPRVDLETNVITIRNPNTESVQAFEDLLASREATPWYLDVLAPSLEVADRVAGRLRALDSVDRVVTLSDFVPPDQEEKLEILADVSLFLDLYPGGQRPDVEPEEQIAALAALRDFLATSPIAVSDAPFAHSALRLRQALDELLVRVDSDGEAALAELERVLLDPIPAQFERLRANLQVEPIERESLPPTLVSRMLAADGHARVQVYPVEDLGDHESMVRFVESVKSIWIDITGLPVNLVESARVTWRSLRQALLWAGLAITLLLLGLWRRLGDTSIALGPLMLAVLVTMASTAVLPISFNFVNVIVLPLLLGIGIDSGVHLVSRAARLRAGSGPLLATTTARAVFFSALTTLASFGSLMITAHRGISSLGALLVVGMLWTLAANLLLLPALLALRRRRRGARAGA